MVGRSVGNYGEFFSDIHAVHVEKGITQRVVSGLHLGAIPFGYDPCWRMVDGEKRRSCSPEHPGGIHIDIGEGPAVQQLFKEYASGATTLSQLAIWLNQQGFRTRNRHKFQDDQGNLMAEPRRFTTASVRGILHNPFYMGQLKHKDELLPGLHAPLVTQNLFDAVQATLRYNSGRSSTLSPRPAREYLLKGIIRCANCGLPMWAQTYYSGNRRKKPR